ncbi:hypothetical protein UF75_4610 [Desulfosporosinus sp. I2]|nr:hypothetical protein UF75_4610 [Desulfosporosinus sp. I2]
MISHHSFKRKAGGVFDVIIVMAETFLYQGLLPNFLKNAPG